MAQFGKKYYLFLIVFLGMLSAFGPFVTDMYLPTLPSMADVFHTTPLIQLGLAASMIGLVSEAVGWQGIFCILFGGIVSPLAGIGNIMATTLILLTACSLPHTHVCLDDIPPPARGDSLRHSRRPPGYRVIDTTGIFV